jgi:hypothetical protein
MNQKRKISIDDVLANEDKQTYKKEEEKERIKLEQEEKADKFDKIKKGLGRPAKTADEKAKRRAIYWTDEEFEDIERIGKLNGMKATEWIKFVVSKEIRRERGI